MTVGSPRSFADTGCLVASQLGALPALFLSPLCTKLNESHHEPVRGSSTAHCGGAP